MKDFTAKEQIFLLDSILIGNLQLFLDRTFFKPVRISADCGISMRFVKFKYSDNVPTEFL